MKKFLSVLLALGLLTGITAGCGTSNNERQGNQPADNAQEVKTDGADQTEKQATENTAADEKEPTKVAATPTEPGEGAMCSMCNMEVYHKDHDMGKYTGQVVTADGEVLFTDDVGCTLNQLRILEEEPKAAWVRDYNTLEWIPVDQAVPVRASIETPMKMGFALFGTEEAANKYFTENPMLAPVVSTMDDVDKIAAERYKVKMEKMKAAQEKAAGNMGGQMNGQMNGMSNN